MASDVQCTIEEHRIGDVVVVAVSGTVDSLTAPQLETAIAAAAAAAPAAVVVDLGAVDFLSSAGMGVLVAAHADITPETRFAVVADGPATARPLKLVGIADLVGLFANLDEAVDAVSGGQV
ncbi:STAS domain-containing protein [Mycobacterium sp. NPDC003323]